MKDTTRTRSALVRAYTDFKENGKATSASSGLDSAATSQGRSATALQAFVARTPDAITDAQLRKELGDAATRLVGTLDRAIDALREMSNRGFRHLPIVESGRIWGVVSRNDFMGMEIDRLDEEDHLWECIR